MSESLFFKNDWFLEAYMAELKFNGSSWGAEPYMFFDFFAFLKDE
mgnify:CR=1 FL=1